MGKYCAAILFFAGAAGLVKAGVFWRPADTSALTGQWLTFGALIGALALATGKWVTDCWKGLFRRWAQQGLALAHSNGHMDGADRSHHLRCLLSEFQI